MRAHMIVLAVAGSLVLAACSSSGALDDAVDPVSSSASASGSVSTSASAFATASASASSSPSASTSASASPSASASTSRSASPTATPTPSPSASGSTTPAMPLVTASPRPSTTASATASASPSSASPSASSTVISTVLRTNPINITFGNGSWMGSFTWDGGYSVSAGQPWEGVTGSGLTAPEITIVANAGRHGTSQVAQWFRQRASAAAVTSDIVDGWPSELNFAFTGTLTANGSSFPVVIGQGNDVFENNWWVGGPGWTYGGADACSGVYSNTISNPPPNGPNRIFITSDAYTFDVVTTPC